MVNFTMSLNQMVGLWYLSIQPIYIQEEGHMAFGTQLNTAIYAIQVLPYTYYCSDYLLDCKSV